MASSKYQMLISDSSFLAISLMLLLLARLVNRQDVVLDEQRKFGSFGCRQCRLVIRPRRGNFHLDLAISLLLLLLARLINRLDVVFRGFGRRSP